VGNAGYYSILAYAYQPNPLLQAHVIILNKPDQQPAADYFTIKEWINRQSLWFNVGDTPRTFVTDLTYNSLVANETIVHGNIDALREIMNDLVPNSAPPSTPPPPTECYIRFVFSDATPISGETQSVTFTLTCDDAGFLNSWWAQDHFNNPDQTQNLIKDFEGTANDTLRLVTLDQAKNELLLMLAHTAPPPPPPPPPPTECYIRFVFSDATPITGEVQSVNFTLTCDDAGFLNSWWAQDHFNNPDQTQNLIKDFEGTANDTLDLVTLQAAQSELLAMLAHTAPPPPPPPPPPTRGDWISKLIKAAPMAGIGLLFIRGGLK